MASIQLLLLLVEACRARRSHYLGLVVDEVREVRRAYQCTMIVRRMVIVSATDGATWARTTNVGHAILLHNVFRRVLLQELLLVGQQTLNIVISQRETGGGA